MSDFFKFPSTAHVATLDGVDVRDDKVLSDIERHSFLSQFLVIEEKVDGANLGIAFDSDGSVTAQNRGSLLNLPGHGQWKKLHEWISLRSGKLFDHLIDRYVLFGEWCYAKHSIYYDSLPDLFLGFDIYDRDEERFFSVERRNAMFDALGIYRVPTISSGVFDLPKLEELISISHFGKESAEGIYLRLDQGDWLGQRAKLVRSQFVQSVVEHWSRKAIEPNRVVYS